MPVVSTASNHAAQMKALIEQCRRLPLRPLISFLFPHEEFDLLGKKSADGGGTAGGEDLNFPHGLPAEAYRHVLLGIARSSHGPLYHALYVPHVSYVHHVLYVCQCFVGASPP